MHGVLLKLLRQYFLTITFSRKISQGGCKIVEDFFFSFLSLLITSGKQLALDVTLDITFK